MTPEETQKRRKVTRKKPSHAHTPKALAPSPRDDVTRHGGALSGAVVGGLAGSFIPVVGTIGGALVGAVVGHFRDERRHSLKKAR